MDVTFSYKNDDIFISIRTDAAKKEGKNLLKYFIRTAHQC